MEVETTWPSLVVETLPPTEVGSLHSLSGEPSVFLLHVGRCSASPEAQMTFWVVTSNLVRKASSVVQSEAHTGVAEQT